VLFRSRTSKNVNAKSTNLWKITMKIQKAEPHFS